MSSRIPAQRAVVRALALVVLVVSLTSPLRGQSAVQPSRIRMRSCAAADSLLGRVPDGVHPSLFGSQMSPGVMQLSTSGYPDLRPVGSHLISFTVTALAQAHPAQPQGFLSVHIEGPPATPILQKGASPEITLVLPDSITLRPTRVILGSYTGPEAFAVAPITAVLTGPSLLALARAETVTIRVDDLVVPVPAAVRSSLADAYRTAVCGYDPAVQSD